MNEDLEKRLAQLEKQLQESSKLAPRNKVARPTRIKNARMITVVALGILIAIIGLFSAHTSRQSKTSTSSKPTGVHQYAEQAGFKVYIPSDLPPGFTFDESTADFSDGILFYSVRGPNSSSLVFSQQKKPKNFDFGGIANDTSFKTPYGTATAYEQNDKSMGSLVTDTTWVVCNSSKAIGAKAMESVLQSLQPVEL